MRFTASRPASDAGRDEQARYAWRVLSVTSLGVLLAGTNTSTLDVALPVVARHFDATATEASWIVLSYMLVNTVLILAFGRIADLVGRRRLYLLGLGTLTAASVLCALSAAVVGALVLALSEGGALGWGSTPVLVGFALFAAALPVFVVSQLRRRYPMLDLRLFADRERSSAYLGAFLLAVARFAVVLLMALYLQAASGLGAFQAGLRVIPVAAGISLASPVAGRLAARYPTRWVASAGLALTAAGLVGLALLIAPDRDYLWLGVSMAAVGVGCGIFMTPNTTSIMAGVDPARRGVANGVRSMLQNTGFVVSTAMSLAIVTSPLAAGEKRAAYAGTLSQLSDSALDDFTGGYRVTFWVLAAACVAGLLASLNRGPTRVRDGPGVGEQIRPVDDAA